MTDEPHGASPPPRGGDDPLDRDLRRLLAVDPSPAFQARVRARVAGEPPPNAWRAGRLWMAFGTAAAALVLAVAVFRPEAPADTGAEPGLEIARAGDTATPSSGAAARPRGDGPAADRSPAAIAEPTAATRPAFPGAPATEPRGAAVPPRATAPPPGPPRFTRVVFSERERGALRQLLAQARNRPVVVPVPAEVGASVVSGEPPAALDITPIGIEPPARLEIPPVVTLEPPARLEIPPITIEPLNLALLDTGAVE